jgi:hypothetical protein
MQDTDESFRSAATSLSHWVSPDGGEFETTFSRLRSAWGKAMKENLQGKESWVATWVEGGDTLEFASVRRMDTQRLRMSKLRSCITNLIHGLQAGITALLPPEMVFPDSCAHEFLDQPTGEMFFLDTERSQKILNPLYKRFEDGHRDILTSLDTVTAWLERAEHFLLLLLAVLLAAGGRAPRMDAVGECKIRGLHRNILHISGSPVWADGLAVELRSYPPPVAWPLYFYVGIVRPFTIKLLLARGALSDLGRLNEHMFVHIFPLNRKERRWVRGDTSAVVDQFFGQPLGLKLDHNDLRQILQHTVNKHVLPGIPTLLPSHQGIYNKMANHTNLTADRYYAIDDLSNFAVDRAQTTRHLAISGAFHAWCGFISANQGPQPTATAPLPFSDIRIQAASRRASLAIAKEGQFNCTDREGLRHLLEQTIRGWKSTWFARGDRERRFPSSEDQVLMEVLATLLFEADAAESNWVNLSGGLVDEPVVTALAIVSGILDDIDFNNNVRPKVAEALEGWRTYSSSLPAASGRLSMDEIAFIRECVQKQRCASGDLWDMLSRGTQSRSHRIGAGGGQSVREIKWLR